MTTRSAQLKGEVATLQSALTELTAAQVDMDKLRRDKYTSFVAAKADLEQGLRAYPSDITSYESNDYSHNPIK